MHCIGNLLLLDASHNKTIGNEPFKDKLASYENAPLMQQKEIKDFSTNEKGEKKWDKESIDKRDEKLKIFVFETWSFK